MFFHFVYSLTILAIEIGIFYFILIASVTYGWIRTKINSASATTISIAVIISARNEEATIGNCIEHILAQSYPKENFELIILDDSSSDGTVSAIEKFWALAQQRSCFQGAQTDRRQYFYRGLGALLRTDDAG